MAKLTFTDPRKCIPDIEVTRGAIVVSVDKYGMLIVAHYDRGVTTPIAYPCGDAIIRVEV